MFKNQNTNHTPRPRNEDYAIKITDNFVSTSKTVMDADTIMDVLTGLSTDGVFSVISVPIQISRSYFFDEPERKGNMNIGYIRSIDRENMIADVTIYSTSVENFKKKLESDDLILSPRILSRGTDFGTFLSFDIIPTSK